MGLEDEYLRYQKSPEEKLRGNLIAIGIIALLVLLKVGVWLVSQWIGLDSREKGLLDLLLLFPLR